MRVRLLARVIACVREAGPQVSMDELARAAGVSKPVLYDAFGDRRGVAMAVAHDLADTIERDVWTSFTTSHPPPHAPARLIRALVTTVLDVVGNDTDLYHFTVQSLRSSGVGLLDNPLAARLHERASDLIAPVASPSEAGVASILADGLFGFLLAAVESWLTHGRRVDRDELIDHLSVALHSGWNTFAAGDTVPASVPASNPARF